MIRAIIWFAYFWVYLLIELIPLQKVKKFDKENRIIERDALVHKTATTWAKGIVTFSGAKVKVIGEENIPKEGGVLFVSNHQGYMDIPILMGFVPRPKGFIAKVELMKIPILSTWMKFLGCIFINRGDARKSLLSINEGAERLRQGHSLVIFPEGTRSMDGKVADFKPGSLKLATKSKVPVVPVSIKGSINIMPKGKFQMNPAFVEVIISPAVIIDETYVKDTNKLSDIIRDTIILNLG